MSYKIKIKTFRGINNTVDLTLDSKKCFLGISIDSPFIQSKHVERVLQWIDINYNECLIIIGDDLHRHNEHIFEEGQSDKLSTKSYGHTVEKILQEAVQKIKSNKFKIVHWNVFNTASDFLSIKCFYEELKTENLVFSEQLELHANRFLERHVERGNFPLINGIDAIESSINYIIEEMAVFTILINSGYKTLIYPGTILQIFKDIVNGDFPFIKTSLAEGIYIDLSIKKN